MPERYRRLLVGVPSQVVLGGGLFKDCVYCLDVSSVFFLSPVFRYDELIQVVRVREEVDLDFRGDSVLCVSCAAASLRGYVYFPEACFGFPQGSGDIYELDDW